METPDGTPESKTAALPALPGKPTQRAKRLCLLYGILAVILALGWQLTLVYGLYGGNWSALFYHGNGAQGVPNEPAFAGTYVFPDQFGFDGQYYRIVAHDPFLTRHYQRHFDWPAMRYRRILVPLLAFALAFGQQPYIDASYIAVMLIFCALGVYWLARYAVLFGRSPKWGLAFLLAPATFAGVERGAIDSVLTALTIGFALYLREGARWRLFLVLAMAGLCRDIGLCLILACAGSALLTRNWTKLALSCASLGPTFAWYGYVQVHAAGPSPDVWRLPLTDLIRNLLHHDVSYVNHGASLVQAMYYVAVLGVLLAFFLSIRLFFANWTSAESLAALAFTMMGLLIQPGGFWVQVYYFGRVLAPLLVLLGLTYFPTRDWRRLLPACMVTPSILVVSAASAVRVVKQLF